jgi:hypothetical protein
MRPAWAKAYAKGRASSACQPGRRLNGCVAALARPPSCLAAAAPAGGAHCRHSRTSQTARLRISGVAASGKKLAPRYLSSWATTLKSYCWREVKGRGDGVSVKGAGRTAGGGGGAPWDGLMSWGQGQRRPRSGLAFEDRREAMLQRSAAALLGTGVWRLLGGPAASGGLLGAARRDRSSDAVLHRALAPRSQEPP